MVRSLQSVRSLRFTLTAFAHLWWVKIGCVTADLGLWRNHAANRTDEQIRDMRKCAVWTIRSYRNYNWQNASSNVFCLWRYDRVVYKSICTISNLIPDKTEFHSLFLLGFCWARAKNATIFSKKKWDRNLVKFALFTCFADLTILANAQFSNFLRSKNWSMARKVRLLTFLQHRNLITLEQTFVYNTSLLVRICFLSSAGNFQFYFCFARKNDWIAK